MATRNRSYREVLRNRRVGGLLVGDLLASVGTGMLVVAMPVETLRIHRGVPAALAIGMVEAAPFVLATILALGVGLGRLRLAPRTLLVTDCLLRAVTFGWLGVLAVTGRLTLPVLVGGLLGGAAFRMVGSSSRRVLATSMAGEGERFAVNGLVGLNSNVALYVLGPVGGGLVVATAGAGTALFADACGALVLLAAVLRSVPRAVAARDEARRPVRLADPAPPAGGRPAASRGVLLQPALHADRGRAAAVRAGRAARRRVRPRPAVGRPRRGRGRRRRADQPAPQPAAAPPAHRDHRPVGMCPLALAVTPSLPVAMIEFGLGGLVWAPFTPVAYSYLQSGLATREQRQVVTLWTTGATVAAPLGLASAGPLVQLTGTRGGLLLSGILTLLLVPIAAAGVLTQAQTDQDQHHSAPIPNGRRPGRPGRIQAAG